MLLLDRSTLVAFREIPAWMIGRRRRIRVDGASMLPTLEQGDQVLIDASLRPSVGDIVVANHPDRSSLLIVKRIAAFVEGHIVLASDNPAEGTDSRSWGPVDADSLLGTVTLVFGKPGALDKNPPHHRPPAVR